MHHTAGPETKSPDTETEAPGTEATETTTTQPPLKNSETPESETIGALEGLPCSETYCLPLPMRLKQAHSFLINY